MNAKNFDLSEHEIRQISAALTLYVSTFERMGVSRDDMPTCISLIEKFSNKF